MLCLAPNAWVGLAKTHGALLDVSLHFFRAETFPAKNASLLSFWVKSSRICVLFPGSLGIAGSVASMAKAQPCCHRASSGGCSQRVCCWWHGEYSGDLGCDGWIRGQGSPAASLAWVCCRRGVGCCEEYRHGGVLPAWGPCNLSTIISPVAHRAGCYLLLLLILPFVPELGVNPATGLAPKSGYESSGGQLPCVWIEPSTSALRWLKRLCSSAHSQCLKSSQILS